eukprot:TRINITY_DN1815_c0_g1_i1.p1 TRINITY_DN1815_c0_g1~~TRINITY_DN1815_c0_g1_i1.p1  ORF type:complete len:855 (+),score=207.54 TRINITY_DN1815_c0_g1_i1:352-2565(+)
MYNEDPEEVQLTLRGVCENVSAFVDMTGDSTFWKRIAVCIVSDGRDRANQNTLDFLQEIGLYDEEAVAETLRAHSSSNVGCHLFQGDLVFVDNPELNTEFPPLQAMFALKEHNAGKIDSHWWFFEAFSRYLQPDYCFLLDVGTKPRKDSFYNLYRSFERNPQIAGACGEITTRNLANLSFLVSGQHFEYKIAGILDKAMESVFGYISVLPGAFSAYRFDALQGNPLRKYFKHIEEHSMEVTSPFEANMYLAEDRILCFELFAKAKFDYTLHFINDCAAETDVPTSIVGLMKQRRRWLNGSFFASLYALKNYPRIITESTHSFMRKLFVSLLFFFYLCQVIVTWFLVGAFFLTVFFTLSIATNGQDQVFYALITVFGFLLALQGILALADKPNNHEKIYHAIYLFQGLYFLVVFGYIVYYTVSNVGNNIVLAIGFTLSLVIYLISTVMYGELMSLFSSFLQYVFITPAFMVMFPIYSFANVHDISWGTKDLDQVQSNEKEKINAASLRDEAERKKKLQALKAKTEAKFLKFRSTLFCLWVFSNGFLVSVITQFNIAMPFLCFLLYVIIFFNGMRLLGSITYFVLKKLTRRSEISAAYKLRREQAKESGKDVSNLNLKPLWAYPLEVLLRPFQAYTYLALFMEILVSPVLALVSIVWILMSSALCAITYFWRPDCAIFVFKSWRRLSRVEFDLFSGDGKVARRLGIDSISMRRSPRACLEGSLPIGTPASVTHPYLILS